VIDKYREYGGIMKENIMSTTDLVSHAIEGNPAKVGDTFNSLIMSKIVDAIAAKKQEIAQNMFGIDQDEDEEQIGDDDQETKLDMSSENQDETNEHDEVTDEQNDDTETDD
jgi:hypothetical protein